MRNVQGPLRGLRAPGVWRTLLDRALSTGMTRSVAEGPRSRPLDETVREALAWHETRPAERRAQLRSGLSPELEAELLAAWHAREPA